MTAILIADSISKTCGDRRVRSSATLRAVPGEFRVLFGRNGIGKSTLLNVAAGRTAPDGGTVTFAGRTRLAARLPDLARDGLLYLPEHDFFSRAFTIQRQLEIIRAQFEGGDTETAAAQLGISERLDARPDELSGGELRRAELAAAVIRNPRCLLADEPYRGISPIDAEALTATLRSLARAGTAVLITGHEVPTLLDAADHISWCTSGTTYELGPPSVALLHERFRREYLGALEPAVRR